MPYTCKTLLYSYVSFPQFATVYKALDVETKQIVAVKKVSKNQLTQFKALGIVPSGVITPRDTLCRSLDYQIVENLSTYCLYISIEPWSQLLFFLS